MRTAAWSGTLREAQQPGFVDRVRWNVPSVNPLWPLCLRFRPPRGLFDEPRGLAPVLSVQPSGQGESK